MSADLEAALRVVLTHLRGTPATPAPSITLPLAEWKAMQEELGRLKAPTHTVTTTWPTEQRMREVEAETNRLLSGYRQGGQS